MRKFEIDAIQKVLAGTVSCIQGTLNTNLKTTGLPIAKELHLELSRLYSKILSKDMFKNICPSVTTYHGGLRDLSFLLLSSPKSKKLMEELAILTNRQESLSLNLEQTKKQMMLDIVTGVLSLEDINSEIENLYEYESIF